MKKRVILTCLISTLLISGFTLNAQEKKIEKRVKIVTIDEFGERVEIDTIYKGDEDIDYIIKSGNRMAWSADKDAKVIIRDHEVRNSGGNSGNTAVHSYIVVSDEDKDAEQIHISVNKGGKEGARMIMETNDLDKDEKIIYIISSDGEENLRIKGDAVITIKDGKLKVENSPKKVKEEKEVKEVKTVKKN